MGCGKSAPAALPAALPAATSPPPDWGDDRWWEERVPEEPRANPVLVPEEPPSPSGRKPEEEWPEEIDWEGLEQQDDPWAPGSRATRRKTVSAFYSAIERANLDELNELLSEHGSGLSAAHRSAIR